MEVSVIDVLKDLEVAIPVILVGTQVITAAIAGVFKITQGNIKHLITWIVGILAGVGFVAFNGLTFGLSEVWNYVLGGVCGLMAAAASNGFYDWPALKAVFDAIVAFLENLSTKRK